MNTNHQKCVHPILFPIEQKGGVTIKKLCADDSDVWAELSRVLKERESTLPILVTPPEFNLELLFYYTCKKNGVPTSIGRVYNIMLTISAIAEMRHDILVTTAELAEIILRTYKSKNKNSTIPFTTIFLIETKTPYTHKERLKEYAMDGTVVSFPHPIITI